MSALVLGQLLAPLQLALDGFTDELGHAVWPDKRFDALSSVFAQAHNCLLYVERGTAHGKSRFLTLATFTGSLVYRLFSRPEAGCEPLTMCSAFTKKPMRPRLNVRRNVEWYLP